MKIRSSLNVYFLVAMLVFGAGIGLAFAWSAFNAYFGGKVAGISKTMVALARETDLGDASLVEFSGYTVTTEWALLPADLRDAFEQPLKVPYELEAVFIGRHPETGYHDRYYLILVPEGDGAGKYVSKFYSHAHFDMGEYEPVLRPFWWIVLISTLVAVAFAGLLLLTLKLVVRPLEGLNQWAESLSDEGMLQTPPEFRYREFSELATIISGSLRKVRKSLDKEHDFLRHASHELRSPLAVVRSNVDLLLRMENEPGSQRHRVVERLDRASTTMNELVQTLLWLSRDELKPLASEQVALDELIRELVDELDYLRQGRAIELHINTAPYTIAAPHSACRIVLANLVRNAFQHTKSGRVSIEQAAGRVSISNRCDDLAPDDPNALGFGLGTRLAGNLAKKFGWRFQAGRSGNAYSARLDFEAGQE